MCSQKKLHWAQVIDQPEEQIDKTLILRHPPPIEVGSITDGMVTELYKHLDEENIKNLAQILNQMWTEDKVPTDFTQAEVVSIYKKGNSELPQNYRPISLLNTSYKILTKICQTRLSNATAIDSQLHDTQFGLERAEVRQNPEPSRLCQRGHLPSHPNNRSPAQKDSKEAWDGISC